MDPKKSKANHRMEMDPVWVEKVESKSSDGNGPSLGPEKVEGKSSNGNGSQKMEKKSILFQFGMSGNFQFTPVLEMPKHSHLIFITSDKKNSLVFVDSRRFGTWSESNGFSEAREPRPGLGT